jgi:hypothetical protein
MTTEASPSDTGRRNAHLVVAALAAGASCATCIASVLGLSPPAVETIVARVAEGVRLDRRRAVCGDCQHFTIQVRLA